MSRKFPDFKSDDEADAWLQRADLTEYDLSEMKKVRFELARKDASISLRLPAALLATLRAEAAKANMPTQRLIRMLIEAQLAQAGAKAKRKTPRKSARPAPRGASGRREGCSRLTRVEQGVTARASKSDRLARCRRARIGCRGEDVSGAVDWDQARRPNLAARRVNVDFPSWVVEALDREARRLGVTRQSLVKLWIAERLGRAA